MNFYILLILTTLWFAFMTWLSHQDGEHTGKTSRDLAERLQFLNNDVNKLNSQLRRMAHVMVFTVFTVLLGLTVQLGLAPHSGQILQSGISQINAITIGSLVFVVFWAWMDEATKPMIRGRHFSWFDVGLNLIGVAIGGSVFCCLVWII